LQSKEGGTLLRQTHLWARHTLLRTRAHSKDLQVMLYHFA
jgi:hypothetical protein